MAHIVPSQVLLSYGDSVDELVVRFGTGTVGPPAGAAPVVRYRPHASIEPYLLATGTTSAFLAGPNPSPNGRTVYLHQVCLANLTPGTRYDYTAGIPAWGANSTWTPTNSFTTRSPEQSSAKMIFFGDTGNNDRWWANGTVPAVAARLARGDVDAVIHTGDMAYSWDQNNGEQGDRHQRELSAATRNGAVPLLVVPGNADVGYYRPPDDATRYPPWEGCMAEFQEQFTMPFVETAHNLWTSYTVGNVHFVHADSESCLWCHAHGQNLTDQLAFMVDDLNSEAALAADWTVLVVHRPFYSSFNNTKEQTQMRACFAPTGIFGPHPRDAARPRVDAILNGHIHSFERSWPVGTAYNRTHNATDVVFSYENPRFPVTIVSGAAGNGESVDIFTGASYHWTWSAFRSIDHGFSTLTAPNATHLGFEFFSLEENKTIDEFWITRTPSTPMNAATAAAAQQQRPEDDDGAQGGLEEQGEAARRRPPCRRGRFST